MSEGAAVIKNELKDCFFEVHAQSPDFATGPSKLWWLLNVDLSVVFRSLLIKKTV
jgi:hypothetical protein